MRLYYFVCLYVGNAAFLSTCGHGCDDHALHAAIGYSIAIKILL